MFQVWLVLSIAVAVMATFPTTLVYQSPTGFALENIAFRKCHLDEVYTFPNATALTGIVEYQPDVYAVVTSALNLTTRREDLGSVFIWRVDFTSKIPVATRIAGIPQSTVINGLSSVPGHPDLVLAADSVIGAAYEITMSTGAVRIAIQDAAMAPGAPAPTLGINGLHVRGGTFARVPIAVGSKGVRRAGAVEILGTIEPAGPTHQYDDFAIDGEGRAWVTAHPGALTLFSPRANGTWAQENAAGDPEGSHAVFTEPTAAAFGRGVNETTLYVTTEGGQIGARSTQRHSTRRVRNGWPDKAAAESARGA
ncbi:hypothetical protein C8R44DRAFT_892467 [Mycena epipterygia]|nr:hypothetical protein C8R44DRAFT_892467 [Mycena epipterygia]